MPVRPYTDYECGVYRRNLQAFLSRCSTEQTRFFIREIVEYCSRTGAGSDHLAGNIYIREVVLWHHLLWTWRADCGPVGCRR